MQKLIQFIRKTSVAIVFIILEIIAIHSYANSTPYTQARLLVWTNNVTGYVYSAFASISSYFGLRDENIRLTDRIAELENKIRGLEELVPAEAVEVEVLTKYEYFSAKVIASTTNRARNFITIDKGFSHGISTDMAVVTPEGAAVGVVVECSENFAVAKTLLNVDFRTSGMLSRDGSHGAIVWPGEDIQVVDFVEVSKYADIQAGDKVHAAGFSHYFPREVVIGEVESATLASNGASYNCKVRLSADMGRLYNVILVRNTNAGEAQDLESKVTNN